MIEPRGVHTRHTPNSAASVLTGSSELFECAPQGPLDPRLVGWLDTPALVVDAARLHRNVLQMARETLARGVALRPHAKTHKSIEIARLQQEHGATGLTVATIGEAEVFAEAGLTDLFIAYPIRASTPKARRLRQLANRVNLRLGADSIESAELLGRGLAGLRVELLVEVDSGEHRTGATDPDTTAAIAVAARRAGLDVAGAFTHGGHAYLRPGAAGDVAAMEVDALRMASAALSKVGIEARVLSAGSTPTALLSAESPVTEVRPGTYVFNDRQQAHLGSCAEEEIGLLVASTVVSRSHSHAVLDAGAKVLSKDLPSFLSGYGQVVGYPRTTITRLYDHHGVLEGDPLSLPALGAVVLIAPNHVCPVVDLAQEMHLVARNVAPARQPIQARSQAR